MFWDVLFASNVLKAKVHPMANHPSLPFPMRHHPQTPSDDLKLRKNDVRAVVRLVDLPSRKTDWFDSEDVSIVSELMKLLPPIGQNFMVIWQEREAVRLPETLSNRSLEYSKRRGVQGRWTEAQDGS